MWEKTHIVYKYYHSDGMGMMVKESKIPEYISAKTREKGNLEESIRCLLEDESQATAQKSTQRLLELLNKEIVIKPMIM